ncbi:MAG: hypothetical protein ACRD1Z_10690, partial [Vicinamibacteria bacterium]
GVADVVGYYENQIIVKQVQYCRPSVVEKVSYYENKEAVRIETDSNCDGHLDEIDLLVGGAVTDRFKDSDKDGKVETWLKFTGEKVGLSEEDTNNDGRTDLRMIYSYGAPLRQEADYNFDGQPDVWAYFKNGKKARQEEDQNYDGTIDVRYEYGAGEQLVSEEPVENVKPLAEMLARFSLIKESFGKTRATASRGEKRESFFSKYFSWIRFW